MMRNTIFKTGGMLGYTRLKQIYNILMLRKDLLREVTHFLKPAVNHLEPQMTWTGISINRRWIK
jgi:hypothetical protein